MARKGGEKEQYENYPSQENRKPDAQMSNEHAEDAGNEGMD